MTLDLTCQACDTSFELDVAELLDEPRLQCPSCDARVPRGVAEALSNTLDELLAQVARLRPKFELVLELESDDLPAAYEQRDAVGDADDEVDEGEDAEEAVEEDAEEADADE